MIPETSSVPERCNGNGTQVPPVVCNCHIRPHDNGAPVTVQDAVPSTRDAIRAVTAALGDFLAEKNRRYGNSAIEPLHVFSRADPGEGIRIRLDDKLSRVKNRESVALRKNDVADLLGYLVLLCVSQGWTDFSELLD